MCTFYTNVCVCVCVMIYLSRVRSAVAWWGSGANVHFLLFRVEEIKGATIITAEGIDFLQQGVSNNLMSVCVDPHTKRRLRGAKSN